MDADLRIVALKHATEDCPTGASAEEVIARAEGYLAFLRGSPLPVAHTVRPPVAQFVPKTAPYWQAFSW